MDHSVLGVAKKKSRKFWKNQNKYLKGLQYEGQNTKSPRKHTQKSDKPFKINRKRQQNHMKTIKKNL